MQFPVTHPNQRLPDYTEEDAREDRVDYNALWEA